MAIADGSQLSGNTAWCSGHQYRRRKHHCNLTLPYLYSISNIANNSTVRSKENCIKKEEKNNLVNDLILDTLRRANASTGNINCNIICLPQKLQIPQQLSMGEQ